MLGVRNEEYITYIELLRADRLKALQTIKKDDGQVLSRTFYSYIFDPEQLGEYRVVEGDAPFWQGIIPDEPETYENPLPTDLGFHYIVRRPFLLEELRGYLIYGQPIENNNQYNVEEFEDSNVALGYVDPARVNLFKGWFLDRTEMMNYEYYVPLPTGGAFYWESSLVADDDYESLDIQTTDQDRVINFENSLLSSVITGQLRLLRINPTNSLFGTQYDIQRDVLVQNLLRYEGFDFQTNTAKLIFTKKNGLFLTIESRNCEVWLSIDGIELTEQLIGNIPENANWSNPKRTATVNNKYPYILVKPTVRLRNTRSTLSLGQIGDNGPPVTGDLENADTTGLEDSAGFFIKIQSSGRFYQKYKEEIETLALNNNPILLEYPEDTQPNLNDPIPYEYDVGPYEFPNDSDLNWIPL